MVIYIQTDIKNIKHTCYSGILHSILMNIYLPGADPRCDKNACIWAQRTKHSSWQDSELPHILSHDFSPWLSWCTEPLTALSLLRLFPIPWAQRYELVSELPAINYEQLISLSSLRPALLPLLTQVPCGMEELEGWPGLARFSELGQQNRLLLPLPYLMVLCLHKEVWRVHEIRTWWHLLVLVAFHSSQDFGCSAAL